MREPFREDLLARSIAAGRRDLAAGLREDILAEAQSAFENTSVARDFDTFTIRKEA